MKRKISTRIISVVTAVAMMITFVPLRSEAASKTSNSKITTKCGVTFYEADEVDEPIYEIAYDAKKDYSSTTLPFEGTAAKSTAKNVVKQQDWYSFSAKYCYNKLGASQKKLYQEMYSYCNYILMTANSYADIETNYKVSRFVVNGYEYYKCISKPFNYKQYNLGARDAANLYIMFSYENPQFYFLDETYVNKDGKFYLGFYELFKNSQGRAKYTNKIFDKVNSLAKQINSQPTEAQKVRKAEEIVMQMNTYCFSSKIPGKNYSEAYDQSIYSAFLMGYTICAGYAKAIQVLLRKCGIQSMVMTSSDHAWNLVKVDGHWYTLDATWDDDDNGGAFKTDYFLKSDDTILRLDYAHHQREAVWAKAPKCLVDYGVKWPSTDADNNKQADYVDKIYQKIKKNQLSTVYTPALIKVKPKILIAKKSYKYTGKAVKPKVTVKVNGHKLLPSEYTVKYSKGCTARGTYKIFVVLKKSSGYKGSSSITYKVK